MANDLVNRGGITFVFRAQEETGATASEVVRAYTVAREIFGFEAVWAEIGALDNVVPTQAQTTLHLEGRRLIDRVVRWLLQSRRSAIDVRAEVERFGGDLTELVPQVAGLLRGGERERMMSQAQQLVDEGVPEELAVRVASLLYSFSMLDIVELALDTGRPTHTVAEVHHALSETFGVDTMLTRITALPRGDRWTALARSALRYDLYAVLTDLTCDVLAETSDEEGSAEQRIASWQEQNAEGLARGRRTLEEIAAADV